MAEMGQERTPPLHLAMSALPPKADKAQTCWLVRFVPKATERTAAKSLYSITDQIRGGDQSHDCQGAWPRRVPDRLLAAVRPVSR